LGVGPQIDAAVGFGNRFVIDQEFHVSIILVGGQVDAMAVVHQFAVLHRPMLFDIFHVLVALGFSVGFGHGP